MVGLGVERISSTSDSISTTSSVCYSIEATGSAGSAGFVALSAKNKLWVSTVQGCRLSKKEGDTKYIERLATKNRYNKVCQVQVIQLIRNPCLV